MRFATGFHGIVFLSSFLLAAQVQAYEPLLPLTASNYGPKAGDSWTLTLDTGTGQDGIPVAFFYALESLDGEGMLIGGKNERGDLLNPRQLALGRTQDGVMTYSAVLPEGLVGTTAHIQAIALIDNRVQWSHPVAIFISPSDAMATIVVEGDCFQVGKEPKECGKERVIEAAYKAARAGDVILVKPHPEGKSYAKVNFEADKGGHPSDPGTWVWVQAEGRTGNHGEGTLIRIARHDVWGDTFKFSNQASNIVLWGFDAECSQEAAFFVPHPDQTSPTINLRAVNMRMDCGYDHAMKSGPSTKWGVWLSQSDFYLHNSFVGNVKEEHDIYSNNGRNLIVRHSTLGEAGRTGFQDTNREYNYKKFGPEGVGRREVSQTRILSVGIPQGNGSALSFHGRSAKAHILIQGVEQILQPVGDRLVGGAFVSYTNDDALYENNGSIVVRDSFFDYRAVESDRHLFDCGATSRFELINTFVGSGKENTYSFLLEVQEIGSLAIGAGVESDTGKVELDFLGDSGDGEIFGDINVARNYLGCSPECY